MIFGIILKNTTFPTIHFTIKDTPQSVVSLVPGPYFRAKISEPDAGGGKIPKPKNAVYIKLKKTSLSMISTSTLNQIE
jgi:hypothetical protein